VNVTSTARGHGTLRTAGHAVGEAQLVKVGEAGAGPHTPEPAPIHDGESQLRQR
jgi:hypothetical protein